MNIWIEPRISEKSYRLATDENTYMFDVMKFANRKQIADAVADEYGVTVTKVRTAIAKGKAKSTPVKRRYGIPGRRQDVKRAYVTLKDGDSISIFEDIS